SESCRLDGLKLQIDGWKVQPLNVEHVESSFFANESVFPGGSVEFDHALVMRDIPHSWRSEPDLLTRPRNHAVAEDRLPFQKRGLSFGVI
ncbi:MAG TPA: hypothetical protein VGH90_05245, partial [Chthoniobacteraceae bacterium]